MYSPCQVLKSEYHAQTMYTIKQAAARSGVSIDTLRAWERRYGVVQPERTPAGYRLYDDDAIARLRAMRRLIDDEGWSASQAAIEVSRPGGIPGDPGVAAVGAIGQGTDAAGGSRHLADLTAAIVDAATRLEVSALETALDEAFATERYEAAMDEIVFPALAAIGIGWASGGIDIAVEHTATAVVRRRLERFLDAAGGGERRVDVVVGLPPGSRHELGALAYAVAARRAGLGVLFLGADTPAGSWHEAVRRVGPRIAVIGVATPADAGPARDVAVHLRREWPALVIAVGGPSANDVAQTIAEVVPLPGRLGIAGAATATLLRRRR